MIANKIIIITISLLLINFMEENKIEAQNNKLPEHFIMQKIPNSNNLQDGGFLIANSDKSKIDKNLSYYIVNIIPNTGSENFNQLSELNQKKMFNRVTETGEVADFIQKQNNGKKYLIQYQATEENQIGKGHEIETDNFQYIEQDIKDDSKNKIHLTLIAPFTSLYDQYKTNSKELTSENYATHDIVEANTVEQNRLRHDNFQHLANFINSIPSEKELEIDFVSCRSYLFLKELQKLIKRPVKLKLYNGLLYNTVYYKRINEHSAEAKLFSELLENNNQLSENDLKNKFFSIQELQQRVITVDPIIKYLINNKSDDFKDFKPNKRGCYNLTKEEKMNLKISVYDILSSLLARQVHRSGGNQHADKNFKESIVTIAIDHQKFIVVTEAIKPKNIIKCDILFNQKQVPMLSEIPTEYMPDPQFTIVELNPIQEKQESNGESKEKINDNVYLSKESINKEQSLKPMDFK